MIRRLLPLAVTLSLLSACSKSDPGRGEPEAADIAAPQAQQEPKPGGDAVQVQLPQIAYTYNYAFRVAPSNLAAVQDADLKLCDELGPSRCLVKSMARATGSTNDASGSLTLLVAAAIARPVGERLVAASTGAGAEMTDRKIEAEDLSKDIVDTDARIRTKEVLVERLTALLQTRSGNMAQAVEAERQVNAAQEELEQARAEVAALRGRVAFSTIEIDYRAGQSLGGFTAPLRDAFSQIGTLLGQSLAFIILILAAVLPWLVVAGILWFAWRFIRRRWWPREEYEIQLAADDASPSAPAEPQA